MISYSGSIFVKQVPPTPSVSLCNLIRHSLRSCHLPQRGRVISPPPWGGWRLCRRVRFTDNKADRRGRRSLRICGAQYSAITPHLPAGRFHPTCWISSDLSDFIHLWISLRMLRRCFLFTHNKCGPSGTPVPTECAPATKT